ncbi:uncharacterized protein LOC111640281 [Centruroides sculpturatus]|uniref:uncharacterized protein LOC111640281 n=1 Tax=Centruroides sculpturatus TaxID=218467 RepID=UPI000C6D938E|nr:uncharacterized protein LOC111640281 [Centruroides sculpturatus]
MSCRSSFYRTIYFFEYAVLNTPNSWIHMTYQWLYKCNHLPQHVVYHHWIRVRNRSRNSTILSINPPPSLALIDCIKSGLHEIKRQLKAHKTSETPSHPLLPGLDRSHAARSFKPMACLTSIPLGRRTSR